MKLVAFADIQIHNYQKFDSVGTGRLSACLKSLRLTFAVADKVGAEYLLFAGDFFDSQNKLPIVVINETVNVLMELFYKYPKISIIAISGNHDYGSKKVIGKQVVTSLHFLSQIFERFILIDDDVKTLGGRRFIGETDSPLTIAGLPDYYYSDEYYQRLNEMPEADILLTHCTAIGYDTLPGTIDPKHKDFSKYKLVLSGDIHDYKWLSNNFLMLGAPLQRDASDVDTDKGVWIIDTDNLLEPEFIVLNSKLPVFHKVVEGDPKPKNYKEGDYIIDIPLFVADTPTNSSKEFKDSDSEDELVTKFYEEVAEDWDEERLQLGLSIVKKVK